MPKKTRKEKLLAQRRRLSHLESLPQVTGSVSHPNPSASSSSFQFHANTKKREVSTNTSDNAELAIIRNDLVKTVTLAALAITGEIIIYWLLQGK